MDRNKQAYIVGGNLVGRDARTLAKEFAHVRRLRPGCKKPVLHIPLRLPEGEDVSDARWLEIAPWAKQILPNPSVAFQLYQLECFLLSHIWRLIAPGRGLRPFVRNPSPVEKGIYVLNAIAVPNPNPGGRQQIIQPARRHLPTPMDTYGRPMRQFPPFVFQLHQSTNPFIHQSNLQVPPPPAPNGTKRHQN